MVQAIENRRHHRQARDGKERSKQEPAALRIIGDGRSAGRPRIQESRQRQQDR